MSKQNTKLSMSGQLAAISHMFYLSKENKIFIIKLSSQQECMTTINIICSLSSSLLPTTRDICKNILMCPPLGQSISISHLKPVTLYKNTKCEVQVYQLTRHSTIQLTSQSLTSPPPSHNLVSYRGIVTSSHPASGCYTLDKTVFLATSLLCVVTNVPCILLATTVTIHNAHIAKFRGKKWLVMCGVSFVQIHDEDLRIHPSQQEFDRNLSNPVINMVQELGGNWTCQEILQLLENYNMLVNCYSDDIILEKLLMVTLENEDRKSNNLRSLSKEFLNHKICCSLAVPAGYKCGVRTLLGLDSVREIIDTNLNLETGNDDAQPEEREIEFDVSGDVPVIIGKVDIDKRNGRIVLKDNKTTILLVGNLEDVELGHFLQIQRMTVGSHLSSLTYIILHKFRSLGSLDKIPPTVNNKSSKETDVKICQVIGKSEVVSDRSGQHYFLIICQAEEEGKIILKIGNLRKYFLIKQNQNVVFSTSSSSCFSIIESISSDDFVLRKHFGQVPWFELRADVNIKISETCLVNVTSVYTLTTAEDIPSEEIVNIVGAVVSISMDESKSLFPLATVHHDKVCKVQLTLGEQVGQENTHYAFYLAVLYPLGLVPGTKVQVTSVIKTRSKKGRTYFHSTPLTSINYEHASDNSVIRNTSFSLSSLQQPSLTSSSVVELLVSLERVLSLVVMVECGGCNSAVVGGRCSYVGCNVDQKFEFTCKATFEVLSVDTFANLISIGEEDIKVILNCSEADWEKVKEAAKLSGKCSQKSCQELGRLAAAGVATAGSCCVRGRRFTGQDWLPVKLFCLKAWRLSTKQINILYEQLLDF